MFAPLHQALSRLMTKEEDDGEEKDVDCAICFLFLQVYTMVDNLGFFAVEHEEKWRNDGERF